MYTAHARAVASQCGHACRAAAPRPTIRKDRAAPHPAWVRRRHTLGIHSARSRGCCLAAHRRAIAIPRRALGRAPPRLAPTAWDRSGAWRVLDGAHCVDAGGARVRGWKRCGGAVRGCCAVLRCAAQALGARVRGSEGRAVPRAEARAVDGGCTFVPAAAATHMRYSYKTHGRLAASAVRRRLVHILLYPAPTNSTPAYKYARVHLYYTYPSVITSRIQAPGRALYIAVHRQGEAQAQDRRISQRA